MKKILITGGSGILGQYSNIFLSKKYQILTTYNKNCGNCRRYNCAEVDLFEPDKILELIGEFQPDVVLHYGAVSRPQDAEKLGKDIVTKININTTKKIAEQCYKQKIKLIFTSTELVYDGNQGAFLTEKSKLNPVSLYAESKLWAEEKIRETFDNFIILRTALLYGVVLESGQSGFDSMFRNLRIGKPVDLFYDQFRTPLSVIEAVNIIDKLINKDIFGETVNLGGLDRLSRFGLGELLCELAGFNKELLRRKSMFDSEDANYVPDVSLNTEKLLRMGIKPKGIRTSILELLEFLKNPA